MHVAGLAAAAAEDLPIQRSSSAPRSFVGQSAAAASMMLTLAGVAAVAGTAAMRATGGGGGALLLRAGHLPGAPGRLGEHFHDGEWMGVPLSTWGQVRASCSRPGRGGDTRGAGVGLWVLARGRGCPCTLHGPCWGVAAQPTGWGQPSSPLRQVA